MVYKNGIFHLSLPVLQVAIEGQSTIYRIKDKSYVFFVSVCMILLHHDQLTIAFSLHEPFLM